MKKMIIVIWSILLLIPINVKATIATSTSHNYLNIYLFCNEELESCDKMKTWLTEIVNKDDDYSLEYLDTSLNKELFQEVKDYFKIKDESLPLTIIGSNYFLQDDSKTQEEIQNALSKYHENNHCDLVSKLKNKEDIKDCAKINEKIYPMKEEKPINYILIGSGIILTLVVGGIIIYFLVHKKKVSRN